MSRNGMQAKREREVVFLGWSGFGSTMRAAKADAVAHIQRAAALADSEPLVMAASGGAVVLIRADHFTGRWDARRLASDADGRLAVTTATIGYASRNEAINKSVSDELQRVADPADLWGSLARMESVIQSAPLSVDRPTMRKEGCQYLAAVMRLVQGID